ncbi:MAG TPA: molybdenum cofactor biosynthesis protein MoaE [Chthoniobacterales bacterium]|jgi:molybdopterin synthase catalytic subunit
MATWHLEILITTQPLAIQANNWNGRAGATLDFWGVVRAKEDGREISGIDYEAHEAMAQHQMKLIANAAAKKFGLDEVTLQHRIGFVAVGDASLFLRVLSGHRGAAYEASAWIVSELKKKVPIWKRPLFVRQEGHEVVGG